MRFPDVDPEQWQGNILYVEKMVPKMFQDRFLDHFGDKVRSTGGRGAPGRVLEMVRAFGP
jgi:hypothetical protein